MLNKQEETLLKELLNKYKQGYISGLIQGDNINLTPSGCRNKIISSTGGGGSSYIAPFLKTGGASWSGTGLVYDVTTLEYYFNGDKVPSATKTIRLSHSFDEVTPMEIYYEIEKTLTKIFPPAPTETITSITDSDPSIPNTIKPFYGGALTSVTIQSGNPSATVANSIYLDGSTDAVLTARDGELSDYITVRRSNNAFLNMEIGRTIL